MVLAQESPYRYFMLVFFCALQLMDISWRVSRNFAAEFIFITIPNPKRNFLVENAVDNWPFLWTFNFPLAFYDDKMCNIFICYYDRNNSVPLTSGHAIAVWLADIFNPVHIVFESKVRAYGFHVIVISAVHRTWKVIS